MRGIIAQININFAAGTKQLKHIYKPLEIDDVSSNNRGVESKHVGYVGFAWLALIGARER